MAANGGGGLQLGIGNVANASSLKANLASQLKALQYQ
jgi:hypothetical protein